MHSPDQTEPPNSWRRLPAQRQGRPGRGRGAAGRTRRGVAIVSFVAALLIIGTLVLWLFQATATSNISSLGHFCSTGALYAAESGIEMGLREINFATPADFDSDGTIGSISNNGNAVDDPALGTGKFYSVRVSTSPPTYRATGRPAETTAPWSTFARVIEIQTQ